MNTIITEKTARSLEAWLCNIPASRVLLEDGTGASMYDLAEIITNGKMAKAFFGERLYKDHLFAYEYHSVEIMMALQNDDKEGAEEHLLEHTIFNPRNAN